MLKRHKIAVLGGGSFGTAIANIMANNNHEVRLWLRNQQRAEEINRDHVNSYYLPDFPLNPELTASTELAASVTGCDIVFVAVPSKSSREVARELSSHIGSDVIVVSTTKGIEHDGFKLMSQVLAEEIPAARIGVLSGPNLASEIAANQITGTVIASNDEQLNETVQALLHSGTFRVYASSDVYGVELGGALKNVYAIMSGMATALGIGQNTISMLLTRSLAEMSRFAVQKGADPMTFLGLAGVGDLIATCMSPLSRNYRVGYQLGEGKDLDTIVEELGQVAEGVNTLRLLKEQSDQMEVYMPLVNGLYDIIYNKKTISEVVGTLMFAEQNRDVEFAVRLFMKIIIMRHGEAHSRAASDRQRELTPKGKTDADAGASWLQGRGEQIDRIWVSPYTRTQQTAREVLSVLGDVPIETKDFLVPESRPQQVIELLEDSGVEHLMLISHQPLVSSLVGLLVDGNTHYGPPMSPASIANVSTDIAAPGCGTLSWVSHAPNYGISA